MAPVRYRTADVDGFNVFYRQAGPPDAPKLLLLHGFPSAGHMFRDLIPCRRYCRRTARRRSGTSIRT